MASDHNRAVAAYYSSMDGENEFHIPISAPCTDKCTSDRIKYLNELRGNTKRLQANINKFLTEKMEQDKLRNSSQSGSKSKKDDELEEQIYGEEQAEIED